jgi:ADP-heptose:LPS heptosyltransferase
MPGCPGIGLPPGATADPEPLGRFVRGLRETAFDLALQMYGGGHYANPFIRAIGARLSVGLRAAGAPPLDRWIHYRPLQNRRLQLLELAALAGAGSFRIGGELQVTERDRREAAQLLPPDSSRPLAVIQPGATDPRRRWPAERFAVVADALAGAGAQVAVNGTAAEAAVVSRVIGAMDHPASDLAGRLSLAGLCGLLERAAVLVANDTGPLHLAVAIGTPAVGIYWHTNLLESGPLRQDRHRPALSARLHCPVCGAENLRERCAHDVSFVDDVSEQEVTELALELFREA